MNRRTILGITISLFTISSLSANATEKGGPGPGDKGVKVGSGTRTPPPKSNGPDPNKTPPVKNEK